VGAAGSMDLAAASGWTKWIIAPAPIALRRGVYGYGLNECSGVADRLGGAIAGRFIGLQ